MIDPIVWYVSKIMVVHSYEQFTKAHKDCMFVCTSLLGVWGWQELPVWNHRFGFERLWHCHPGWKQVVWSMPCRALANQQLSTIWSNLECFEGWILNQQGRIFPGECSESGFIVDPRVHGSQMDGQRAHIRKMQRDCWKPQWGVQFHPRILACGKQDNGIAKKQVFENGSQCLHDPHQVSHRSLGCRTAPAVADEADRPAKRIKLEHTKHEEVSKLSNPILWLSNLVEGH